MPVELTNGGFPLFDLLDKSCAPGESFWSFVQLYMRHRHDHAPIHCYRFQGNGLVLLTGDECLVHRAKEESTAQDPATPLPIPDEDCTTNISYRIETKKIFVCTYNDCNKRCSRVADLYRHHREAHLHNEQFKCRAIGCNRAVRGFPRREKRDTHEKKMHILLCDGVLL